MGNMRNKFIACCLLICGALMVEAFSLMVTTPTFSKPNEPVKRCQHPLYATTRRDFAQYGIVSGAAIAFMFLPTMAVAAPPAAPSSNIFDKNFSVDDAKKRFQDARRDLGYLLDNYSEISSSGGGDAVRNYLGTQGVNSHLYGIQKVLKLLTEESEDIVEYSEAMEEFNAYYFQAEGAAYQSMFAEHSSAKATPESCLATAKQDIVQMAKYMDQLALQLNL